MMANDCPRSCPGMSGMDGKFISRAVVVNWSGSPLWVSWRQACSTCALASAGHHSSPASTRAVMAAGSMLTRRMAWVLISTVSARGPIGATLWPVPWPATRKPRSRANLTAAATSCAVSGIATAAGRWSTARFQALRASSQPGSSGVIMGVGRCGITAGMNCSSIHVGDGNVLDARRGKIAANQVRARMFFAGAAACIRRNYGAALAARPAGQCAPELGTGADA